MTETDLESDHAGGDGRFQLPYTRLGPQFHSTGYHFHSTGCHLHSTARTGSDRCPKTRTGAVQNATPDRLPEDAMAYLGGVTVMRDREREARAAKRGFAGGSMGMA